VLRTVRSASCGQCRRSRLRSWCSSRNNEFVAGGDVFDFGHGGVDDVLENHGIAGLGHRKIRLGGDDHAKGLHVGDGFHFARATLQHHFAEIHRASFGRNGPQNIGEIFETESRGLVHAREFRLDLDAAPLVLHFGLAAGLRHQFGALKVDLHRTAGAAVIHRLGGARNTARRSDRNGRGCLTRRRRRRGRKKPGDGEKSGCDFHVTPLFRLKGDT